MTNARYLVGIDLGTTNSSLAYVDRGGAPGGTVPRPVVLPIPQLVAPGRIEARESLPSFVYLPEEDLRSGGAGDVAPLPAGFVVGVYAREQGALRPTAQVASAKSWLCHPTADRTARILPWGAEAPEISPVGASAHILAHLRDAWNEGPGREGAEWRLETQDVVLTVPASFDQEARELTLQAARDAGLARVTLLEEPLAAFYAWTATHRRALGRTFAGGERVLVCDVGGGTSDFTLITVRVEGGQVGFEREAVGEHLLLGGDNLDLALARRIEQSLGDRALSVVQRLALRRSVSTAKERLLSEPGLDHVAITVLGSGRGVVGGALTTGLTRQDVEEVLTEGFLPRVPASSRPQRGTRTGLLEMGLPYAADPAVTRHLAEFLARAAEGGALAGTEGRTRGAAAIDAAPEAARMVRPDAVLFNGGFFTPALARDRLLEVLARWFDPSGTWRPAVLENESPAAAVALGAASYALVRETGGLRVRAGSSRAYYIGIASHAPGDAAQAAGHHMTALCILPRGTDEGTAFQLTERELSVVTNRPVSFPLYSSATRHDGAGDLVELDEADLHRHAPLATVLRYGRKSRHVELAVSLSAAFTETGTLEVSCESRSSEHRWRLQFQLRGEGDGERQDEPDEGARSQVAPERLDAAKAAIASAFEGAGETPEALPSVLETTIGFGRMAWPTPVIRALADTLLQHADGRRRGPSFEARWLNLVGFCLRPGFGAPLDEWRVGRLRGVYVEGVVFASDLQCQAEWAVTWQRVAGGLKAGQQQELFQRYGTLLGVRGPKGARRLSPQVQREAWRLLASLEHLGAGDRVKIGDLLLERIARDPGNASYLWAIARLGARTPAYGPLAAVVPAERAAVWIERLLSAKTLTADTAAAVAQIGARTDDPLRDVDEGTRARAVERLGDAGFEAETQPLESVRPPAERDARQLFGEQLPAGLRLGA